MIDNKLALIAREFIIIVSVTEITLFYDRTLPNVSVTQFQQKWKLHSLQKKFFGFFCRAIVMVWTQIDIRHQRSWTQVANLDLQIVHHWDGKSQAQEQEQLSSFFCRFNLFCLCICVKPEAVQPNWSRWSHKMMCCLVGADSWSLKKNNLNTNSHWQHAPSDWAVIMLLLPTAPKHNQRTMTGIICL